MSQNLTNDLILRAARGETTTEIPVWFMRQAGRSLPEYRAIRGLGSILDTIQNPEVSAEITLQPVRRYNVDAAILYSDIVVPVYAVGFGVEIVPGKGPVIDRPFRSAEDLLRLRDLEPEVDTDYVLQTIKILTNELKVPLIGFAGAPFTVASYLIEGGPSKSYVKTKSLMRSNPELWHQLMSQLSRLATISLASQIRAGASMYQLFDSWVGVLSPQEYKTMVAPHSRAIFEELRQYNVPSIHFGVGTSNLLDQMAESGCTVVGVDDKISLTEAYKRTGGKVALQGNLDPVNILIGIEVSKAETKKVLQESTLASGYIFNLGHGVMPESDPNVITALVDYVREVGPLIRQDASEQLN